MQWNRPHSASKQMRTESSCNSITDGAVFRSDVSVRHEEPRPYYFATLFDERVNTERLPVLPGSIDRAGMYTSRLRQWLAPSQGRRRVLLFISPAGWPKDVKRSYRREASSIAEGGRKAAIVFTDLPPNDYGVVALPDENHKMKLGRNVFGWPKEGLGFAHNSRVGLRPPGFPPARLQVTCPVTETEIHVSTSERYLLIDLRIPR